MYLTVSSMNRLSLILLLSLGAGLCLQGQTATSITISTNPTGPRFQVDGTTYMAPVTFTWPTGSTHYVVFVTDPPVNGVTTAVQTALDGTTQWAFNGWQDNNHLVQPNGAPIQVITANPAVTTFTATVTVAYRVSITYNTGYAIGPLQPTCGAPGAIPVGQSSPGVVYLSSQCYWTSFTSYVPAGTSATLNAYPYPGFAFTGWSINGAAPTAFLTTTTIIGPTQIIPVFVPAERVSFMTSPPGMQVLVDHTPAPTRTVNDAPDCPLNETMPIAVQLGFPPLCYGDFDFVPGSTHFISGVTPQRDHTGNWWVFSGWNNGQAQNSIYQVGSNANAPTSLIANFVQGAQVSFVTSPPGLKLNIDGNSNYASYNFIWGIGSTHTVAAATTQKGPNGRAYSFKNWSNQAAASQTVTMTASMAGSGYRLTANYNELSRVVVQSVPPGLKLQVDGQDCMTPCNVDRDPGAKFHVTAPTQVAMGSGARLDFGSWTDGGDSNHDVTVNQDFATVTAMYNTMYLLNASSKPGNGSGFKFSPSSSDMFYKQGSQVAVTSMPKPGFKFGHWSGDLTGSYGSGTVTLVAPGNIVANMISVPYLAPAGIRNGVGETPSASVAPGSIISIFGQSLASVVQAGPVNPLAQSIAGTTVTVNNMFLPLMFVSPQQINAQLPSNLPDGKYTLEVQNIGQPDISGTFTVARNAPGLFFSTVGSTAYATAFHANGSLVTTSSPAAAGETISFLGTGFGPYDNPVLDGFFPSNPPPAVRDSVVLSVNGQKVTATSTAAPNFAGVVSTQFEVPSGLASGTAVALQVSINGVDSNTVMLPIQ